MNEHAVAEPELRVKTRVLRQHTIHQNRHRLVLCIELTNNGPLVPEHLLESLFLPMVSGRANGTGLGLSIAQTIAEQHQGMIEFRQKPHAITFSLVLPISHESHTPEANAS
jgi:two-component system nitrogen regulation sensor histidine kinase GlnL